MNFEKNSNFRREMHVIRMRQLGLFKNLRDFELEGWNNQRFGEFQIQQNVFCFLINKVSVIK